MGMAERSIWSGRWLNGRMLKTTVVKRTELISTQRGRMKDGVEIEEVTSKIDSPGGRQAQRRWESSNADKGAESGSTR